MYYSIFMVGPKARTVAILSSRLRVETFICASSSSPAFCADEQRPRLGCDRLPPRNRQKRESAASKHDDRVRNTIRPSRDSDSGDPVLCQARGKTRRPSLGVVGRNNPRLLPPPRQPPHETRFSFHENDSLIVKALENVYVLF